VRNRGRNLVGRTDPDDVPTVTQELPTLAEEIGKANDAWRAVYEEETAYSLSARSKMQAIDYTLRTDDDKRYEKGGKCFDPWQFKESPDNAVLADFSIERLPPGGVSGISSGSIAGSPTRAPRRPNKKTWWAFRADKVEELVASIAASSDWPPGSDKRAGYIVLYYFKERRKDQETHKLIPKVFESAEAVKQFRKRLNEYAAELFGTDPDAKPESLKHWAQKLPDIRPNRGAYFECDEQDPNTKLQWLNVAVHNSTLAVGPARKKGVR
jgi:hypothetical protein